MLLLLLLLLLYYFYYYYYSQHYLLLAIAITISVTSPITISITITTHNIITARIRNLSPLQVLVRADIDREARHGLQAEVPLYRCSACYVMYYLVSVVMFTCFCLVTVFVEVTFL